MANYMAAYGTDPTGQNLDYGTTDPRKIATQQRRVAGAQYNASTGQQQDVANYLNPIESNLAEGGGGYNQGEQSQIQLSPEDKQNIITSAGISAGTGTAAAAGAADRAAAMGGGNPLATAAYRLRASQQQGQQAGNAMTQARVAAQEAGSRGAQAVGNARMGQQAQGLNYYGNLQNQYNQNAQSAANRQLMAGNTALQASQTPSTFDKIMGGITGFLGALEGGEGGGEGGDAVVGEGGPEKVVNYMEDGGMADDVEGIYGTPDSGTNPQPAQPNPIPWYQQFGHRLLQSFHGSQPGQQNAAAGGVVPGAAGSGVPELASAGGRLVGKFLEHGQAPQGQNGIFTRPTRVHIDPGEAVVPLGQKQGAKTSPSMAFMPAAKNRIGGGQRGGLPGRP